MKPEIKTSGERSEKLSGNSVLIVTIACCANFGPIERRFHLRLLDHCPQFFNTSMPYHAERKWLSCIVLRLFIDSSTTLTIALNISLEHPRETPPLRTLLAYSGEL